MEQINRALKLKKKIEAVMHMGCSIGKDPQALYDFTVKMTGEEDEEKRDQLTSQLRDIYSRAGTPYFMKYVSTDDQQIHFNGKMINFADKRQFELVYNDASVATFGDVSTQTTKIDASVRRGRDITSDKFVVNSNVLEKLERMWNEAKHEDVKVKPYKITLYQEGDFFDTHMDTPHDDVIGTMLISLTGNHEVLEFPDLDVTWNERRHNCIGFYGDVKHKVSKIDAIDSGRAVISFKVHSQSPKLNIHERKVVTQLKSLFCDFQSRLKGQRSGFVFTQKYGYSQVENGYVKAYDDDLCQALIEMASEWNMTTEVIPVLRYYRSYYDMADEDNFEACSYYYPITNEILNNPTLDSLKSLPWYVKDEKMHCYTSTEVVKGQLWRSETHEGAEYTGNESLPETSSSVYVQYMVILYPA